MTWVSTVGIIALVAYLTVVHRRALRPPQLAETADLPARTNRQESR